MLVFDEIAELPAEKAPRRMQEIYQAPLDVDLMGQRVKEIKASGVVTAGSLTPQERGEVRRRCSRQWIGPSGHPRHGCVG